MLTFSIHRWGARCHLLRGSAEVDCHVAANVFHVERKALGARFGSKVDTGPDIRFGGCGGDLTYDPVFRTMVIHSQERIKVNFVTRDTAELHRFTNAEGNAGRGLVEKLITRLGSIGNIVLGSEIGNTRGAVVLDGQGISGGNSGSGGRGCGAGRRGRGSGRRGSAGCCHGLGSCCWLRSGACSSSSTAKIQLHVAATDLTDVKRKVNSLAWFGGEAHMGECSGFLIRGGHFCEDVIS